LIKKAEIILKPSIIRNKTINKNKLIPIYPKPVIFPKVSKSLYDKTQVSCADKTEYRFHTAKVANVYKNPAVPNNPKRKILRIETFFNSLDKIVPITITKEIINIIG